MMDGWFAYFNQRTWLIQWGHSVWCDHQHAAMKCDLAAEMKMHVTNTHTLSYTNTHRAKRVIHRQQCLCVCVCVCVFTSTRVSCQQVCRPNTRWHNYYRKRNRVHRGVCVCVCVCVFQGWSGTLTTLVADRKQTHVHAHPHGTLYTVSLYPVWMCFHVSHMTWTSWTIREVCLCL